MLKLSERSIEQAHWHQVIASGDYYLGVLPKGEVLRITDLEGNQAADVLFYNAQDPKERYCIGNTISSQRQLYLSAGSRLMSNAGRVMLEIVADNCGRHDTLGGACATESNTVRYDLEKRCMHACRDSWMLALAEHPEYGINKADIGHNINFFMNVPITPEGGLSFADGISGPGKYVELLAHMDTLVVLSNCPQLNNPCNGYNPTPIELRTWAT